MITKLHLDSYNEIFNQYRINDSDKHELANLKRINIFVGANNSGKSRYLRELFHSFSKKEIKNGEHFDHIDFPYIDIKKANEEFDLIFKSFLELITPDTNKEKEIEFVNKFNEQICSKLYKEKLSFNEYASIIRDINFRKDGTVTKELEAHNEMFESFIRSKKSEIQNITFSVYIPVLRSLKNIITNYSPPPLKARIHKDYFDKLDMNNINIYSGEDLYKRIKKSIETEEPESTKVAEFEDFLSTTFFNCKIKLRPLVYLKDIKGDEITNSKQDLFIKIGSEPEFPISNTGDGIQALIMLTFPLFFHADKNHLLFIEEPELNMHPGLQRLFLETLNDARFNNTQVFITTHSNHFLDLAIESSPEMAIFSFEKQSFNEKGIPQFIITDITKRSVHALNLLGVHSSSVFLSNCTIWVEGISDRLFIKKYLDLYQSKNPDKENDLRSFNEDIHFSFVEYAGNNIEHWSFLDIDDEISDRIEYLAISKNVFLITDKDKSKKIRHKKLEMNLGDNYCCLNCLEIENLLEPEILKRTIEKYIKNANDKISFPFFIYEDYKDVDIGEFIYSIIIEKDKVSKITSKPRYGRTKKIADKYKFAKNAIACISNWDDLSVDAQQITRSIYNFIKAKNEPYKITSE